MFLFMWLINRSDADKYTPNVEDETVDFGGKVDLTDNVTNLGDLPSGTTVTDVTKLQLIRLNQAIIQVPLK